MIKARNEEAKWVLELDGEDLRLLTFVEEDGIKSVYNIIETPLSSILLHAKVFIEEIKTVNGDFKDVFVNSDHPVSYGKSYSDRSCFLKIVNTMQEYSSYV